MSKQMRLEIDDDMHDLLMKEQKKRRDRGLPKISLKTLLKLLAVEGLICRRFTELVEVNARD